MDERPHFFSQTPDTLAELFEGWGLPRYRVAQVCDWVYRKGGADPRQMTTRGKADRVLLGRRLRFLDGAVVRQQRASDGTRKLLIDWGMAEDGAGEAERGTEQGSGVSVKEGVSLPVWSDKPSQGSLIVLRSGFPAGPSPDPAKQTECVMIPSDRDSSGRPRRTACISSQVGCPVGCRFCASGLGGLDGNLTAGQIVQQVWQLQQLPTVGRITNVVFMGMGEPMANLRSVLPAIRTLAADWGMGLSARKITVSTVGVPAGIRKLADLDLPVTLAISLHAPNDAIRKRIIPWAEFVSIAQLVEAGSAYFAKTGREITLEYILLGGVNDQAEHARELAGIARRLRSNLNLIRYNEVAGLPFVRPSDADVLGFQAILKKAGINTHIRASRGRDIAAACGQLRHESAGS